MLELDEFSKEAKPISKFYAAKGSQKGKHKTNLSAWLQSEYSSLDSQVMNMNPIPEVSIAFGNTQHMSKGDELKETAVTRSGNLKLKLPNFFSKKRRSFDLEENSKNFPLKKDGGVKRGDEEIKKSQFQETSMCETDRHREAIRAARLNFKRPQNKVISNKKRRKNRTKERKSKGDNSKVLLFEHKKSSKSQRRLRRKKDSKRNISASKILNRTGLDSSRGRVKTERGQGMMKEQFQSYLQKMSRISKGQKSVKKLRNSRSGKLITKIIGSQKFSVISNHNIKASKRK